MSILSDLQDARNRALIAGHILYGVSEALTPGKVLCVAETEYHYAYTVFHSDDEARAVSEGVGLPLMHLRDAPRKPLPLPAGPVAYEPSSEMERWRTLYGPGVLR
jgi:hypothetical protein